MKKIMKDYRERTKKQYPLPASVQELIPIVKIARDGVFQLEDGRDEDEKQYDKVYLVFPNWWADLPMAVYSFFEEYDFSGKTIYVTITHEGSGFSRTLQTIRDLEPNAVVEEGLSIRGGAVPEAEEAVRAFAQAHQ